MSQYIAIKDNRKPKILILAEQKYQNNRWELNSELFCSYYRRSLEKLGAEPNFISYDSSPDLIKFADGLLIPGGKDIDPKFYKKEKHPLCLPSPWSSYRVEMEKQIWAIIPDEMPVLGICYGLQILNVLHGGDLEQHIEGNEEHDEKEVDISIDSESLLYKIINQGNMRGKCYHHQCIKNLGKGLKITAWDINNLPHAIEGTDEKRWVVGVQWHPERSVSLENEMIIREFVSKSAEFSQRADELKENKNRGYFQNISCTG